MTFSDLIAEQNSAASLTARLAFLAVDFQEPLALFLLVFVGAFAILVAMRAGGRMRKFSLLLRTLALATLVLALARPRTFTRVEDLSVAFVLDVSDSIPSEIQKQALADISHWMQEVKGEDSTSLVVFAERPSVEIPLLKAGKDDETLARKLRLDGLESRVNPAVTDLAAAITYAQGLLPRDTARRIVLASDGNATRGDLETALDILRSQGIHLDVYPLRYSYDNEVVVETLTSASRSAKGEALQLRGVIHSVSDTSTALDLKEDGKIIATEAEVRLKRGANVFRWTVAPDRDGHRTYELVARPKEDGNPANNIGRTSVVVSGSPMVRISTSESGAERLGPILENEGLVIIQQHPHGLPSHPAEYVGTQALILENTPAFELSEEQKLAIRDAVKELGMGLVVTGGPLAFNAGGYRGTPIEEILPVDLDVTNKRSVPKGALAIILHSIEFDSGNTWAVRICKAAIDSLQKEDEAAIVYYGRSGEEFLFELQPIGDGDMMTRAISRVVVGDMPSFHRAFTLAAPPLLASNAAVKHIVVISDGDPQTPSPELMKELVDAKVTISTICVDPHSMIGPDTERMADLAAVGRGRAIVLSGSPSDVQRLPRLIMKEASTLRRASIVEKPFTPVVSFPGSQLLRGLEAGFPELLGYGVTSPREGAETILLADKDEGDPLLATWYAGLGRVVAFTSDVDARWAKNWLNWDRFGAFWSQVVRSVIQDPTSTPFPVNATANGLDVTIRVDAFSESGEPHTGQTFDGTLLSENREPIPIKLSPISPGVYGTTARLAGPGTYLISLISKLGGETVRTIGTVSAGYSPEMRSLRSQEDVLEKAAKRCQGKVLDRTSNPFRKDLAGTQGLRHLWPFLALLAAILVCLDVTFRRFDFLGLFARRTVAAKPGPTMESRPQRGDATARPIAADDAPDLTKAPAEKTKKPDPKETSTSTLEELKKAQRRAEQRRKWQ